MMQALEETGLAYIFVGVFGIILGSFFNVCIARIPGRMSLLPRSRCPHCLSHVPWYLNFPVLSWVALRGRCANCQFPISVQYPLVEISGGILFLWVYLQFGLTLEGFAFAVFLSLLLVISVIDLHHQIIPDELSLPGIALGFVANLFLSRITWWESGLGAFLGGGVFIAIATLYEKITKREGLGGGDVKLLGMIGAWLGYQSLLPVIIVSSALGSVVGLGVMAFQKRDFRTAIPFGPFLAVAAVAYLFWGSHIETLLFPTF
jgi:leader peptidase (prepilin peptidase)/N-methyltransferase